jgi:sulfur-carrier protein adenylyltransferase/sulfurtransferase
MKEISAAELKKLIDEKADFQLIDVREEYEYDDVNINGTLIPMGEVMSRVDEISRDRKVVVHCRSGARSASVISALERHHGFDNLYNLRGGIMAYLDETGK